MRKTFTTAFALYFLATATSAHAITGVKMISTPGDYIGLGIKRTFLPPEASVSAFGHPGGLIAYAGSGDIGFSFEFSASSGALVPGTYPDAIRDPSNFEPGPNMDVSGDARGCSRLKGWFRLREFEIVDETVTKLAIDFMQRCEVVNPPLYGSIRINSSLRLVVPRLRAIAGADFSVTAGDEATLDGTQSFARTKPPLLYQWTQVGGSPVTLDDPSSAAPRFTAPEVGPEGELLSFRLDVQNQAGIRKHDLVDVFVTSSSGPRTRLSLYGDPGDYITAGQSFVYTPNNSELVITHNYADGIGVHAKRSDTSWDLYLEAPAGKTFEPGVYEAGRLPFQDPDEGGLSLGTDDRWCTELTGSFTVYEAEFDERGDPEKLSIVFEQHCEGAQPAAYGELLLNALPHDASVATPRAADDR